MPLWVAAVLFDLGPYVGSSGHIIGISVEGVVMDVCLVATPHVDGHFGAITEEIVGYLETYTSSSVDPPS